MSANPSTRRNLATARYMDEQSFIVVVAFGLVIGCSNVLANNDRSRCGLIVREWADAQNSKMTTMNPDERLELLDLLFFLHIPRTGGRDYYSCLLKKLLSQEMLCPRSYDKLRFNTRCRLLSTHDDYSLLLRVPEQKVSVITIMRSPVHRILSAYEFSAEVASRYLRRPRAWIARKRVTTGSLSTLDIWPWKFLVPMMQKDLFKRHDFQLAGLVVVPSTVLNVYDVPSIAMPLEEFIHHPLVHQLLHNGATFQIAGITNNSFLGNTAAIRDCVGQFPDLGHYVLDIAKKRLNNMLFVGLTERHIESAKTFAQLIHKQISLKFKGSGGLFNGSVAHLRDIYKSYESCSTRMRTLQIGRRIQSGKILAPVNFTEMGRKNIPGRLITQILQMNQLDIELYKHAELLYARQKHIRHEYLDSTENGQTEEVDDNKWAANLNLVSDKQATGLIQVAIGLPIAGCLSFIFICILSRLGKLKRIRRILFPGRVVSN